MRQLRAVCLMLVTLALLLPAFNVAAQDSTFKPDLGGRTITVAVENGYRPFNFLDANGEAVGWDYDAVTEICVRLNCAPEFVQASWEGMILAVSNGEFDVAADGITITSDRKQQVDFSFGYVTVIQRLMVRVDESRFATLEEFQGGEEFIIGVQLGTTNAITAKRLVGDGRLVEYTDFGLAVQALIAGDVDAVVIDDVAGEGYTGENAEQIKLIEDPIPSDDQLAFIFPKGSELVGAFNWALMSMAADGRLNEVNAAWNLPAFIYIEPSN